MSEIVFYEDSKGTCEVWQYLYGLKVKGKSKKTDRVSHEKIIAFLKVLAERGVTLGEPYVKKIDEKLWELHPVRQQVLFFYKQDNKYVILHHFIKNTTQITQLEMKKVRQKLKEFLKNNKFKKFDKYLYDNNIVSPAEREAVKLDVDLILKMIDARKQTGLTQKQLAEKIGIKLSDISRIENLGLSSQTTTIIKALFDSGYTLKIVPLEKEN